MKLNMFFQVVGSWLDIPEHTNGKWAKRNLGTNHIFLYIRVGQATCIILLFFVEHRTIQKTCRYFCQILATKMYRSCSPFAQQPVRSLKLTPPSLSYTELSQHPHLDNTSICTGDHTTTKLSSWLMTPSPWLCCTTQVLLLLSILAAGEPLA